MILESKDPSFRLKEKVSPKAFAKIETREEKVNIMIYVENVKYVKSGYRIILIQDDLTTKDIGRVLVNENGKGEFKMNFDGYDLDVKSIALKHENNIPLIGFKGKMIDNYEELINQDMKREEYTGEVLDKKDEIEIVIEPKKEEFQREESLEIEEEEEKNEEDTDIEQEEIQEELEEELEEEPRTKKKKDKEKSLYSQEEKIEEKIEYNQDTIHLIPRKLKKLLKKHKEIKPFIKDIDNTRWWKIDINPMSMCSYTMPYLGYINYINYTIYSDVTSLSYKYRHYIFGIKYSCDGNRKYYVYGIPGRRNEQPDEGETGFCKFMPCDEKNKTYGYWICCIDCKSRLIAVADK
jgi:hypothetical protein